MVATESNQDIRKHILRLIGTLGAVDPYLIKQITRSKNEHSDEHDLIEVFNRMPELFAFDETDGGMRNINDTESSAKKDD